jgi:hypothetical protein
VRRSRRCRCEIAAPRRDPRRERRCAVWLSLGDCNLKGRRRHRRRLSGRCTFGRAGRDPPAAKLKSHGLCQIHPKAIAAALVAPRHFGRRVGELFLHIALVDFSRGGEAGTQGVTGQFCRSCGCRSFRTLTASPCRARVKRSAQPMPLPATSGMEEGYPDRIAILFWCIIDQQSPPQGQAQP